MERRLYRSTNDRMVSGVCGGLGEYLQIDATIIRLGMAVLALASCGTVLMLYLIAIIIMPEAPRGYDSRRERSYSKTDYRQDADDLYETSAKTTTRPEENEQPTAEEVKANSTQNDEDSLK